MAQRNNDEIKKDIEDIGKFSKTAGRDLDSLKAKLESFFNKYTKLTTSQKKQLADIISEYDNLEDALEQISKENTKFKDISDDILQTVQDIKDELREQSGIYTRLTKIINEQVDSIDEEKTLVDKINKSREHSSDAISKNNILSKVSLDILSQQLKDLRLLEAVSILDKNTVSEDFLDRLKQSRITSKEIVKLLNLQNKLQTINSEILGYQNELKDTKDEEERISIQKTISKLEGKSLKIQKEYNTYAKENKDIINKTLADRTKSVAVLLSEKKQLRQINDIYSEYANRVDDNLVTYSAIARLIPGIGDDLSNAFLEANHIAQDSMRAIKDKFIETRDPIESLQAGWSIISKTISKIPAGLVAIGIAVGLIAFALKGVYDLFMGILEKTSAIKQETGIASDQAYELYKNALAAQTSFSNQLSTLEDIVAVQTSFINNFGRFTELTSTTLSQISDAAKVFGYSAETAARLQGTFMELGADEGFAGNLQIAVANLAKANKIAPGIIAKDLVENSEMIAKNFAGMPIEAAKAAIETRKLGYSLQQAGKIQDHLFDIQGSLTAQMEASVALGRLVNTNEARRLALNGDIAGMMREISKEAGSYADFQNMSVPQRMLLAKSFGLEVSELQRSLFLQEKLSDLSDEEMEYAQKHLKNLEGVESMTAGQLKAEISRVQEAEKFNVLMQKFKNQLMRAILPLAEALLPIFEALVSVLQVALIPLKIMTPFFKLIGFLVEGILTPLRWISQLFDWILSGVSKFADALFGGVEMSDKLAKALQAVIGVSALLFLTWSGGFKKIGGLVAKLGSSFTSLFNPKTYQKFFSGFSSMGEKVFGKFYKGGQFMPGGGRAKAGGERAGGLFGGGSKGKVFDSVKENYQQTAQATTKTPKGTGVKEFLTNLSEGLKSMGSIEVTKGALNLIPTGIGLTAMIPGAVGAKLISKVDGKSFKQAIIGISEGLQIMSPKDVIKGSLALVVASIGLTAMIPGAVGAKLISKVDGESFKQSITGISEGLQIMSSNNVAKGSLVLVVASIGLTAMIPGAVGAKLISTINGESLSKSLEGLSTGLSYMASSKVVLGSLALVAASIGFIAMIPATIGMALLAAVAPLVVPALASLGTALVSFGTLMSSGVAMIGLAALIALAIGLGYAIGLMSPAIEALAKVTDSIFNGIVNVINALTNIDVSSIAGLFLLGPALISFSASLAIASVAIISAIPAMLLFGIAFSMFSKSISKASEPILQLSDSIASLVDNLMKLTSISLSTIKEDIKGLGDVSKNIESDISAATENVKVNSSIQSSPISTEKNSGEEPKTTTKSFEERNNALGDNSTVRMLSRLVALMEQSTANPPNLVLEFDDGTVSRLKTRIKKTV